jgi:hypothetical protein
MEHTLDQEVEAIALDVRYWAEGRAEGTGHERLDGWCAIASGKLFKALKAKGYEPELHVWMHPQTKDSHVYVVLDDHVICVTATQFKEFRDTPVVIMHYREAQAFEFFQGCVTFETVDKLRIWQRKSNWPAHQIVWA